MLYQVHLTFNRIQINNVSGDRHWYDYDHDINDIGR
jgi:hypothetical protein